MQPKQASSRSIRWIVILIGVGIIAVWFLRHLLWQAVVQLFLGIIVAWLALPVMKLLEKKLSAGIAATLSMLSLSVILLCSGAIIIPLILHQLQQLGTLLPQWIDGLEKLFARLQYWLSQNGFTMNETFKQTIIQNGQSILSGVAPSILQVMTSLIGNLGKWLIAPVFAFYFLRDRKRITQWLLTLLPLNRREMIVRMFREMRRETLGYLRGQLMVSAVVGAITAVGFLFCGVPAWFLLGTMLGILELLPYVGPFLGGVLTVLFTLQNGLSTTLWALGVVIFVQQLESTMLSPQLMSDATRLHPVAILLSVLLGGSVAGIAGILLSVPLVLCIRAILRVIAMEKSPSMMMQTPNFTQYEQNSNRKHH